MIARSVILVLGLTLLLMITALGPNGFSPVVMAQDETEELAASYIPREECAACHDEADTFVTGVHGRAIAARGGDLLERSCTTCHGPGDAHIEEATAETIVRFPSDQACIACHGASPGRLALANVAHRRHDLACSDCHDEGHPEGVEQVVEPLLKSRPFELCGDCHGLQASSFFRPFAHREGAQPFDCTSCHTAHGTGRIGRLASASQAGVCADCHEDQAGPHVFPHPPLAVEGCLACHQPHGSTNPRMLTRRTVLNLCLECHADVPRFHDVSQPRFRNCQTCHSAVHGSNRDGSLFDE